MNPYCMRKLLVLALLLALSGCGSAVKRSNPTLSCMPGLGLCGSVLRTVEPEPAFTHGMHSCIPVSGQKCP